MNATKIVCENVTGGQGRNRGVPCPLFSGL
jgi:hypothetical protein